MREDWNLPSDRRTVHVSIARKGLKANQ